VKEKEREKRKGFKAIHSGKKEKRKLYMYRGKG
jgi:hypothetical protein